MQMAMQFRPIQYISAWFHIAFQVPAALITIKLAALIIMKNINVTFGLFSSLEACSEY